MIAYDLSISKKWANIPGSEYTKHICVHILFDHLKIESKFLQSKSTINPCDHIWLEHLKKVSKSIKERIYNAHLCPYLLWITQNRKQIAREQIDYTTCVFVYDLSISKKWANIPGSQYIVHNCVHIWFQYLKIWSKSTREHTYYTPLWSYITWTSQKVSKSPR